MPSYSSPLPSYVTPGWNDPPVNVNSNGTTSNNRLLTHKYRRPVHPSIQVLFFLFYGIQTVHIQPSSRPKEADLATRMSTTSSSHNSLQTSHSQQFSDYRNSVYDAFTIPSASYNDSYGFAQIRLSTSDSNFFYSNTIPQQQNFTSSSFTHSLSAQPHRALTFPIETNPAAMIYTPPNVITENDKRPATSPVHPSYITPIKAAGDVSLTGAQLAQFMIKATLKLQPFYIVKSNAFQGVTQDGIRLRIDQFQEMVHNDGISEGCLKKLNFVVDGINFCILAMDRGLYIEATNFFELMQQSYPIETKSGWAQGLKLLLNELRKPTRVNISGPICS
ncbi:unnamed protein product [Dracunculus medinensis]|uniref:Pentatricopeptide repeat-containing protein n=1 Tax=Dracunculus medinensis TaxID=318479 RepID=A0A0N4UK76_DRAME|nr:unnamed protein product [Dracunculus medinensis]